MFRRNEVNQKDGLLFCKKNDLMHQKTNDSRHLPIWIQAHKIFSSSLFSVCNGGLWICEDRPCAGTCSIRGRNTINTFDRLEYRIEPVACGYTLVQVKLLKHILYSSVATCEKNLASKHCLYKDKLFVQWNTFNTFSFKRRKWFII